MKRIRIQVLVSSEELTLRTSLFQVEPNLPPLWFNSLQIYLTWISEFNVNWPPSLSLFHPRRPSLSAETAAKRNHYAVILSSAPARRRNAVEADAPLLWGSSRFPLVCMKVRRMKLDKCRNVARLKAEFVLRVNVVQRVQSCFSVPTLTSRGQSGPETDTELNGSCK